LQSRIKGGKRGELTGQNRGEESPGVLEENHPVEDPKGEKRKKGKPTTTQKIPANDFPPRRLQGKIRKLKGVHSVQKTNISWEQNGKWDEMPRENRGLYTTDDAQCLRNKVAAPNMNGGGRESKREKREKKWVGGENETRMNLQSRPKTRFRQTGN